jgi:hypothetical protein
MHGNHCTAEKEKKRREILKDGIEVHSEIGKPLGSEFGKRT